MECDTVLFSVGLIPENELTKDAGIEMNRITNGPSVNQYMETSKAGVFACGNVVHLVKYFGCQKIQYGKAENNQFQIVRLSNRENN